MASMLKQWDIQGAFYEKKWEIFVAKDSRNDKTAKALQTFFLAVIDNTLNVSNNYEMFSRH